MRYMLGPWIWGTDDAGPHWRAPDGCAGCLDLRSIPQQSVAGGTPQGFGLFALRDSAPNPGSNYRRLGTSLDDTIGPTARTLIGSQLGVGSLSSNQLNALIYELLTVKGDHTGDTFARPLMPQMNRLVHVGLAGQHVYSQRFNHEAVQHTAAIRQIREQYRANRLAESEGRLPRDHHRRVLDFTQKKLRIPWENLVPPEYRDDPGPFPHDTVITESFNQGDSTTLGPDLSWTEVVGDFETVSNKCEVADSGTADRHARAETDLSSDDHYAQADLSGSFANRRWGVALRFNASATTCYEGLHDDDGVGDFVFKFVTGTRTILDNGFSSEAADPATIRFEYDGSAWDHKIEGTSYSTGTDTAITGNLRTGIASNDNLSGNLDLFEAADLSGGLSIPVASHHYTKNIRVA